MIEYGILFYICIIEQANECVDSADDYCKSKVEGKTYTKQYSNQRLGNSSAVKGRLK